MRRTVSESSTTITSGAATGPASCGNGVAGCPATEPAAAIADSGASIAAWVAARAAAPYKLASATGL